MTAPCGERKRRGGSRCSPSGNLIAAAGHCSVRCAEHARIIGPNVAGGIAVL
jgi:hypothetical protein